MINSIQALTDRPIVLDRVLAVVALAVAVPALAVNPAESASSITAAGLGLAVVGCGALLFRRRFPEATLLVVAACRVVMAAGPGDEFALMPAVAIALYTVARSGERRRSLTVSFAVAAPMALAVAAFQPGEPFLAELTGEAAVGLLPIAVADGARARADRLRDLIDAEAEVRVQAERLRIARDLHDIVAHGLAVIAVQSGVAAHLLDSKPEQARESLEVITATGKQSLEELRTMVGVLRSTDHKPDSDSDSGKERELGHGLEIGPSVGDPPLLPTPSDPDDLSPVIAGAFRAGLSVDIDVAGRFPGEASDAVIVATHRILQEALTNVARHAGAVPATVRLVHGDDAVDVLVRNQGAIADGPAAGTVPRTGVGIVGMVERAESVGGWLTAVPVDDGGFEVRARLPYRGVTW